VIIGGCVGPTYCSAPAGLTTVMRHIPGPEGDGTSNGKGKDYQVSVTCGVTYRAGTPKKKARRDGQDWGGQYASWGVTGGREEK